MDRGRVIIVGFDGMDYAYTQGMLDSLPNIRRLHEACIFRPMKSVFPPDSIPAWITCYTGMDPSEHGILESVDYLAKKDDRLTLDISVFRGHTFWDAIGAAGNKVCVVNPFMAYPVWPVQGVMVNGPVFMDGNIQVSNHAELQGIDVPQSLGGITDFPTRKNLDAFIEKTLSDTQEQADFGLRLLHKTRPDLFFQTFLTMDRMQHFLWRYCDKDDPTYPGPNPYMSVIHDFYQKIDTIIGRYLSICGSEDILIVVSDHGHGMRCTKSFNVNEFLRRRGDLVSSAEGKFLSFPLIIERLKNAVLHFLHSNDLEDYIGVIAKFVPNAKKLKKGKHITRDTLNKAFASDFTGTNPFGGICITKNLVGDYERYRFELISDLLKVQDQNRNVVKWARCREDMFQGDCVAHFPDILFCLDERYGVNWNLHTHLFTENPTHKKISGGHRENGVFLSSLPADKIRNDKAVIMENLYATILGLFGIDMAAPSGRESFLVSRT